MKELQLILFAIACLLMSCNDKPNYDNAESPEHHETHKVAKKDLSNWPPRVDEATIRQLVDTARTEYTLVYCYSWHCPHCEEYIAEFIDVCRETNCAYQILLLNMARDTTGTKIALNQVIKQRRDERHFCIITDDLYEERFKNMKPVTERFIVSFGHKGKGECNKFDRFIQRTLPADYPDVPDNYGTPSVLLFRKGEGCLGFVPNWTDDVHLFSPGQRDTIRTMYAIPSKE